MAGEWTIQTFSDLVGGRDNIIGGPFGSNLTQADYVAAGVPVIRGGNMEKAGRYIGEDFAYVSSEKANRLQSNQIEPGDLVVTQRGTMGQVSIVPFGFSTRYIVSQSQMGVRVQNSDPLFVYYLLRSPLFLNFLDGATIQTGVPHINMGLLRTWEVSAPDVREQRRIADVLGSLDDKIELNRRMAETLEATARALFKSWFVDFDPVRAKAEGRPPSLSDDLAALFPDSFGEDGLPDGWANNADAIAVLSRSIVSPEEVDPTTPYIGLEHLPRRNLTITQRGKAEDVDSAKTAFAGGDLLFGKLRPYFHKVSIAPVDGICSSDIFVFKPRAGIPATFLYFSFSQDRFVENASNASSGTRMPRADWSYMRQQPQVLPPPALLREFDHLASPLIAKMLASAQESRTLADLRDILLPKLISGELRIVDAERKVSAA